MRTVQTWTCELGYGADTMLRRTYFLFINEIINSQTTESHSVGLGLSQNVSLNLFLTTLVKARTASVASMDQNL